MKITVSGTRQLTVPAECVGISLTLGFTGEDRGRIVDDTARLVESVRGLLERACAGGGGHDARLSGLRTWTTVRYDSKGRPAAEQHVAEVRGSVTIDDLSRVGSLLGELTTTDGVQVGSLDWRLTDETQERLQPEVLAGAYQRARQRAEWIANAAGLTGISVVSVQDGGGPTFRTMAGRAMLADRGGAPSIELDPEDVDVSANLTVEFDAS